MTQYISSLAFKILNFMANLNKSDFQVSTQMLQTLPDYVEQDLKRRQPLK